MDRVVGPFWWDFVMPWEVPSRWHPIKRIRWRARHRRICVLEYDLKLAGDEYYGYHPQLFDPYSGYG